MEVGLAFFLKKERIQTVAEIFQEDYSNIGAILCSSRNWWDYFSFQQKIAVY